MNSSTLSSSSSCSSSLFQLKLTPTNPTQPSLVRFATHHSHKSLKVTAQSNPILHTLTQYAKAAIVIGVTATVFHKSTSFLARAEPPTTEEVETSQTTQQSPLSDFLGSNSDAVDALKSLLQQKLENGENDEALKILQRLEAAQPNVADWKSLTARLLGEMSDTQSARQVLDEILEENPLSFEALFENALLMDRSGEGAAVISRLEAALRVAEEENKAKETRDVKLIMAQIQFLHKNVEEALSSYNELVEEDPKDFRPYFCRGMIYSLLDRDAEAKEQFEKYRQLSPKKFEVDGYLRKPLSRIKLFGGDDN